MLWLRRALAALVLAAACAAASSAQQAERRLALVIGNGAYSVPAWRLANPTRDAALMAERLRGLGFEVDAVAMCWVSPGAVAVGNIAARAPAGMLHALALNRRRGAGKGIFFCLPAGSRRSVRAFPDRTHVDRRLPACKF
jgi:hypothetical protein